MPQRDIQLRNQMTRGQPLPPPPPPLPSTPSVVIGTPLTGPGGTPFSRSGSNVMVGPGNQGLNGTNTGFVPRAFPGAISSSQQGQGNNHQGGGYNGGIPAGGAPHALGVTPNSGPAGSHATAQFPPLGTTTAAGSGSSPSNLSSTSLPSSPQDAPSSATVAGASQPLKILDKMRIKALSEKMDTLDLMDLVTALCGTYDDALNAALTSRTLGTAGGVGVGGGASQSQAATPQFVVAGATHNNKQQPKLNASAATWQPQAAAAPAQVHQQQQQQVPQPVTKTPSSNAGSNNVGGGGNSPFLASGGPSGQDLFQQYANGGAGTIVEDDDDGGFTDDKLLALTHMVVDEYE